MASDDEQISLVLISGLAGSGYSTALHILADAGFSAVDNLPLALVDQLISLEIEMSGRRLAVSLDGRTSGFDSSQVTPLLEDIRKRLGDRVKLIFLSAQEDVIYRRFNATRRHHPLDHDGDLRLAIRQDWARMSAIESLADSAIDTSNVTPAQFRVALLGQLGLESKRMPILIQSFSYHHGIPHDADLVFDMRFLSNPHWQPELAAQTGLDKDVQDFLKNQEDFQRTFENIKDLLKTSLPRFKDEGRPQVTIAVGCTGGRHRSVFTAITLAAAIKKMGFETILSHREMIAN